MAPASAFISRMIRAQLSLFLLPAAVPALLLPEVCCRFKTKLGQGRAWVGRVEKAEPSPHSPPLRESQLNLWFMGWFSLQDTAA